MLSPVITLSGAQITTLHCQRKERKTITGREEKDWIKQHKNGRVRKKSEKDLKAPITFFKCKRHVKWSEEAHTAKTHAHTYTCSDGDTHTHTVVCVAASGQLPGNGQSVFGFQKSPSSETLDPLAAVVELEKFNVSRL